jgi:hypothetical protein
MLVSGPREELALDLLVRRGWFGARVSGESGAVEGWVQIEPNTSGPEAFGQQSLRGQAFLAGQDAHGERVVITPSH